MAIFHTGNRPFYHYKSYDRDEEVVFSITYRPETWEADKEYISADHQLDVDNSNLIIPSVPNGWMYECSSGGISSSSEPAFLTTKNSITIDNTCEWKAMPYSLLLMSGDTIASSTWIPNTGESIKDDSIVGGIQVKFTLFGVLSTEDKANITNRITINRASGSIERYDNTIIIKVSNK